MAKAKDRCPTDVILHILVRLPVKTLTRFKCVSKPWLKLISDPFFVRSHCVRSQKGNPLQLFSTASSYDKKKGEERLHLSFFMGDELCSKNVNSQWTALVACCLVILLSCYLGSVLCYVGFKSILAYKPSTRERVTLPSGSHCLGDGNEGKVGFAYLPDENEYKAVRLFYKRWVHHPADFFGDYEIGCEILTVRDGAGHWRVVPDEYCPLSSILSLSSVLMQQFTEIELWVLKDYDSRGWFKEYRIDLSRMDRFNMDFEYAIPKDIRDGNILMEADTHRPNRLNFYNVENKSFRNLIDLDSGRPVFTFNHSMELPSELSMLKCDECSFRSSPREGPLAWDWEGYCFIVWSEAFIL
ncbi:hypothetical protein RJ640_026272 [Escallonia rubra]|uniref:F-box domain-containing protein n=1 Tax=Escallonia rubra TaxID=112253 RepID=A0AA88R491_9ASTE|nr:hypothetical protein RJ640_026272 [Escallonia rubra]